MLDIELKEQNNIIIISLSGDFYLENVDSVERVWNEQIRKKPAEIALCFRNIKFIDSSAIGVLVKFFHNASDNGVTLILYDLSEIVMTILKTAKIDTFFKIMSASEFESRYFPEK